MCCEVESVYARSRQFQALGRSGETEEAVDERNLPGDVALRQPPHLTFTNHLHCFDTLNCSLWNVFEVKKFAEGEPHVGKDTTMCILRQSGFQYLNGIGVAYLEELFEKNTLKEPPRVDLGEAMVLEETNPSTF